MIKVLSIGTKLGKDDQIPVDPKRIRIDCRVLANPIKNEELNGLDGTNTAVQTFVTSDPRFDTVMAQARAALEQSLNGGDGDEDRQIVFYSHYGLCRSYVVSELFAQELIADGKTVTIEHIT